MLEILKVDSKLVSKLSFVYNPQCISYKVLSEAKRMRQKWTNRLIETEHFEY